MSRLAVLLPPHKPDRLPVNAVPRLLHWAFVSTALVWMLALVAYPERATLCRDCAAEHFRRYEEASAAHRAVIHRPLAVREAAVALPEAPNPEDPPALCGMQMADESRRSALHYAEAMFMGLELQLGRMTAEIEAHKERFEEARPYRDRMSKELDAVVARKPTPGCHDCPFVPIGDLLRRLWPPSWPGKAKPLARAAPPVLARAQASAGAGR